MFTQTWMLCVVHSLRFQSAKKCHRGAQSTGSVVHWKALERMQTILVSVHNSELGKQERKGSEYLSFHWFTIEDKSFLGKIPQTYFFSQIKPWAEKPYRRVWYKGKKKGSQEREERKAKGGRENEVIQVRETYCYSSGHTISITEKWGKENKLGLLIQYVPQI